MPLQCSIETKNINTWRPCVKGHAMSYHLGAIRHDFFFGARLYTAGMLVVVKVMSSLRRGFCMESK